MARCKSAEAEAGADDEGRRWCGYVEDSEAQGGLVGVEVWVGKGGEEGEEDGGKFGGEGEWGVADWLAVEGGLRTAVFGCLRVNLRSTEFRGSGCWIDKNRLLNGSLEEVMYPPWCGFMSWETAGTMVK